MTEDSLQRRLTRALPAACWVAAIAWMAFSIQWISFSLRWRSLISLAAAIGAVVVATVAVIVTPTSPSTKPAWLRVINLLILALLAVGGGLLALTMTLSLARGAHLLNAVFGAFILWHFVHLPVYSFLPRGTNWPGIVAGTALQWTLIAVLIARVTRGVRKSWAVALSAGTILAVAAAMVTAFLLLGFRTWIDTP